MTFNKVVFDIETTMTADKVWCIVCKHEDTFYQFKENNLHRFEEFIKQTKEVIGHNIIGFDIPVIKNLYGVDLFDKQIIDTLVVSRLINPNKEIVLFCAAGGRSALATKTLKEMGYKKVCHIQGGFTALKNSKFKITYYKTNQSDHPVSKVFNFLSNLKIFKEYCTYNIYCILEK